MTVTDNLLAKARALLAKAESTEYGPEAETLNLKAAQLIARHGIDEALLTAAGAKTDVIGQLKLVTRLARSARAVTS